MLGLWNIILLLNTKFQVFLQPIAYMVEMKEQLEVTDLKGNKIGIMNVSYIYLNMEKALYIQQQFQGGVS